jgi:hypothetical protein
LAHGADEDDDRAEVKLSAKKAYGGGRDSLTTTVAIAAEAQTALIGIGERLVPVGAAGLARIFGRVETAAARRAAFLPGNIGEIAIDGVKKVPESGAARQFVVHVEYSKVVINHRSTPLGKLDLAIRLFEGIFFRPSEKLLEIGEIRLKEIGRSQRPAFP